MLFRSSSEYIRTISLPLSQVAQCRKLLRMTTINILRYPPEETADHEDDIDARNELCLAKSHTFVIRTSCKSSLPSPAFILRKAPDAGSPEEFRPLKDPKLFELLRGERRVVLIGVGSCCEYTEQSHYLGLVVKSSSEEEGAEGGSIESGRHENIHIRDWRFRAGTASRSLPLKLPGGEQLRLRLAFHHLAQIPPDYPSPPGESQYRLHVELLES